MSDAISYGKSFSVKQTHTNIIRFEWDCGRFDDWAFTNCGYRHAFEHSTHHVPIHTVQLMYKCMREKTQQIMFALDCVGRHRRKRTHYWVKLLDRARESEQQRKNTEWRCLLRWEWGRKFFVSTHSIISSTRSRTGVKKFSVLKVFFFGFKQNKINSRKLSNVKLTIEWNQKPFQNWNNSAENLTSFHLFFLCVCACESVVN